MIKPYGPTTDPCIILLVIAVTDEHTLYTLYIVASPIFSAFRFRLPSHILIQQPGAGSVRMVEFFS